MEFAVGLCEPFRGDVGVYLGGGDCTVAEEFLHGAKIGTVVEQVGGKRMPKRMGSDVPVKSRGAGMAFDDAPDGGA